MNWNCIWDGQYNVHCISKIRPPCNLWIIRSKSASLNYFWFTEFWINLTSICKISQHTLKCPPHYFLKCRQDPNVVSSCSVPGPVQLHNPQDAEATEQCYQVPSELPRAAPQLKSHFNSKSSWAFADTTGQAFRIWNLVYFSPVRKRSLWLPYELTKLSSHLLCTHSILLLVNLYSAE